MDAKTYFNRLNCLLSETQVTEGQGLPIDIDAAVDKVISLLQPLSGQPPKVMAVGNGGSAARAAHCSIVTFSGFAQGNPLRSIGDINFYIPSSVYGLVEVAHTALCHYITDHALHCLDVHRKAKT